MWAIIDLASLVEHLLSSLVWSQWVPLFAPGHATGYNTNKHYRYRSMQPASHRRPPTTTLRKLFSALATVTKPSILLCPLPPPSPTNIDGYSDWYILTFILTTYKWWERCMSPRKPTWWMENGLKRNKMTFTSKSCLISSYTRVNLTYHTNFHQE